VEDGPLMPSLLYERKPDGSVRARLRIGGRLRDLGRHPNEAAAYAAIAAARAGSPRVKGQSPTVEWWAGVWQRYYPGKRNPGTTAHNASMVAPFVREHGALRLADVTPLMAQAWGVAHPAQVKFLRLMFGKACKAGLLGLNVWAHVEVPDRSQPRLPPTTAGLGRMVACARARGGWWEHFAECLIFAAHSGLRREEVERVQTQDVLDAGERLVVRGKRRPGEECPRVRVVALFGPARAALLSEAPDLGRVWRAEKGGPLTQDVVDRTFKSLAVEVNVDSTFHGLRHYCSSWLLDQGASRQDVAVQLGHLDDAGHVDTTQVQRRYGHVAVEPALQRLVAVTTDGGGSGDAGRGEGRGAAGG
jgi:hypothetical protein